MICKKKIIYIFLLIVFIIFISPKLFGLNEISIYYLLEKYLNKTIELKFYILFNFLISIIIYADLNKKKN